MSHEPEQLFASLREIQRDFEQSLPPVELWDPPFSGDLDIRIDREGRWFYEDSEIQRAAMVRLFSNILKREAPDYFLVTPSEKWRIQVDEAPFVFIALRELHQAPQKGQAPHNGIVLTTNTDQDVLVSANNPFWMEYKADGEPRPMALVRQDMPGLLNRATFYQLVEACSTEEETGELTFYSDGSRFSLGPV